MKRLSYIEDARCLKVKEDQFYVILLNRLHILLEQLRVLLRKDCKNQKKIGNVRSMFHVGAFA